MALAKYFSKDRLAIHRLINTDHALLENKLNETVVSICFDENCINTFEGRCGIELLIRLLSRLYPKLKFIDLSGNHSKEETNYTVLASKINSQVEIVGSETKEDITIVAGNTKRKIISDGLMIYFGSNNWISQFSTIKVFAFGDSTNPFGAALSSCIVASNVFRYVFREYLSSYQLDKFVELSAFSCDSKNNSTHNPSLKQINLKDTVLAGVGAIGNGFVWALSKIEDLRGTIHLVDDEKVSLTNLQRYILLEEDDENGVKVEIAKRFLIQKHLNVIPYKSNWDGYLNTTNNWDVRSVAVGIDNIKDRIGIQSSLPKDVFNAFTEAESLAITRHNNFSSEACLACSNIPTAKVRNFINEVADNCNIPAKAELVKDYYNLDLPVEIPIPNSNHGSLLLTIAEANGIPIEELNRFNGMTMHTFYSNFICGGVILEVSKVDNKIQNVDAPLAFQSAMAGILLAAEIVKHSIGSDDKQEQRTDFYHLSPIKDGLNPFHRMIEKDKTGRCICGDDDFVKRYKEKWQE